MKNNEGYPNPTAEYAINGVRWEENQRMREQQYGLKRGEIITIKLAEREDDGKRASIRKQKMRVVEFYKHHVLLESLAGIRECMGYWKLNRCICNTGGSSVET